MLASQENVAATVPENSDLKKTRIKSFAARNVLQNTSQEKEIVEVEKLLQRKKMKEQLEMKKIMVIKTPFGSVTIGKTDDLCNELDRVMNLVHKYMEATNVLLSGLNKWMQSDWTEDERERVNNPKEYYANQRLKKEKQEMESEPSEAALAVLKNCVADGNIVKLPAEQLERNIYLEVKKRLELIGGKWKGGNTQGFVFQESPSELLSQIANGDKRNLKKEFQFFGTPAELANKLVEMAEMDCCGSTLEPSAGQGAILDAIKAKHKTLVNVWAYELMDINYQVLQKNYGAEVAVINEDFLTAKPPLQFDRVIANPPFSNNQDIDHIRKMYEVCKEGGRIVSIASNSWRTSNSKKKKAFADWLNDINADIEDVPRGAFKESGTTVGGCIVTINK